MLSGFFLNPLYAQHSLEKIWETKPALKVPESVLLDSTHNILYVSNVDGSEPWAKDGKGSIAKVSVKGGIIDPEWIKGLNGPKGMGLYKNRLYVADITEVVEIDITKSSIVRRIPVRGSQNLNDISVDGKTGAIYVSDSKERSVYSIRQGKIEKIIDSSAFSLPNGVLRSGSVLYILDDGTLYKYTGTMPLTKIAVGMEGGTDGVEKVGENEFLVTGWFGVIYYVHENGSTEKLLDTRGKKINAADLAYDATHKILYVPTFWANTVVAYKLK